MEDNFARLGRYNKSWDFHCVKLHLTKINEIQTLVRERLGFNYFGLLMRQPLPVSSPPLYAFCNYPRELVKLYCEREFWRIDPRINSIGDQDYMIWHRIFRKKTHMYELLSHFNEMKDGVTYCFPLQDGSVAYMSFAGETMVTDAQVQAMAADAYLICKTAIDIAELGKKTKYKLVASDLSPQQLGILRLTADGMTAQQIAREIFLTKAAVDYHLKIISKKMACHNKTQIIAKAALMSLL
ncbi:hypothetical protein AWM79_21780 [Pseudomonas agarici]|uniref:Uncharacterized protein n=2 Tax=Pseudomonas agarici TaxID=46677 RepID=A0A0X1T6N0_PSEAA|nr:LuxR family transcriptional regulator [Pseudomonas agarici]AMB87767.1 hypothetical protein AWM79_21780 [Pseudomonas agarici]NWB93051.1 LuxR family transcriptional regulator [Pseudomonas agarici]NWC10104.1 LuxR family transcriptional regulator [Pseudomonas agarici]SEL71778.1 regulatory protein, luxR family [Pseudomonas agarici]